MLDRRLAIVFYTTKKHIEKLDSIGLKTVKDLLLYFPRTYNDNTEYRKIADISTEEVNILKGRLTSIFKMRTRTGKTMVRGVFTDDSGSIGVIWFNQGHLTRVLPRNKELILSGKVKGSMGKMTLQSPSYEFLNTDTEQIHSGRIVPTYHETEGLNSKWIRSKIKPLIQDWTKHFIEYMPESVLDEQDLISYGEAIKNMHFPENNDALVKARERLAFDELFLLQLKVLKQKWHWQNIHESDIKKIPTHERALQGIRDALPFQLTKAQDRVLTEILADLNKPYPMRRLVQGDVGSGKTIVAALAALNVVKEGYQVAIMAPTEILAKQHYKTFVSTLKGLNIQFIAGST
ncbi:DEAD/DEAH box helicase family protein, partial [Candidatus Gracilibacteria bacterium]|nr:DEAD/DEAH box helicase family protein [Candidatus Gracilibacteria bacterium]